MHVCNIYMCNIYICKKTAEELRETAEKIMYIFNISIHRKIAEEVFEYPPHRSFMSFEDLV